MKMQDIWFVLKPHKKSVGIICLLMFLSSAISFISPFVNKQLLDAGLIAKNYIVILICAVVLFVLAVARSSIQYLQGRMETVLGQALSEKWKEQAFEHSLRLKSSYFQDKSFYKIVHDAMYDVDNILRLRRLLQRYRRPCRLRHDAR